MLLALCLCSPGWNKQAGSSLFFSLPQSLCGDYEDGRRGERQLAGCCRKEGDYHCEMCLEEPTTCLVSEK